MDTPSTINVIMGRELIYAIKGVVSTLHQVMRCQSLNGLYTIDIKGDQSQSNICYSFECQGGLQKMTKGQVQRFDRAKDAQEEVFTTRKDAFCKTLTVLLKRYHKPFWSVNISWLMVGPALYVTLFLSYGNVLWQIIQ